MILQKAIDMTRPAALYFGAIVLLIIAVFVAGRLGLPLVSRVMVVPFQRVIAAVLIFAAIGSGLLGAQRYDARVQAPWRVPQVQVLVCFILFFIFGLLGIAFSS